MDEAEAKEVLLFPPKKCHADEAMLTSHISYVTQDTQVIHVFAIRLVHSWSPCFIQLRSGDGKTFCIPHKQRILIEDKFNTDSKFILCINNLLFLLKTDYKTIT